MTPICDGRGSDFSIPLFVTSSGAALSSKTTRWESALCQPRLTRIASWRFRFVSWARKTPSQWPHLTDAYCYTVNTRVGPR